MDPTLKHNKSGKQQQRPPKSEAVHSPSRKAAVSGLDSMAILTFNRVGYWGQHEDGSIEVSLVIDCFVPMEGEEKLHDRRKVVASLRGGPVAFRHLLDKLANMFKVEIVEPSLAPIDKKSLS